MADDSEWMKLPTDEKCVHKVWKARVAGYEEAAKLFTTIDNEKSPEFSKYLGVLKKFVTDSNALAQEKALDAVLAFVENAAVASKTCSEVINGIVTKCLNSSKQKTKDKSFEIILMYIEIDKQDIVQEELMKGLENKQPKVVVACIQVLRMALRDFGSKVVQIKPIIKVLPKLLEDRDKNVRDETKQLIIEVYRWIGAAIRPQLSHYKPVQVQELEAEFDKLGSEKPIQSRFMRSQQDLRAKMEEQRARADEDGASAAATDGEAEAEVVDAYDLLDAVEIVSKLPKDFYEKVEEKKWQERKEALEAVQKLTDLPKIENGDFHDLVKALKKVISKDSNVMLVILAAKCVTGLARGTRKKFSTHATGCIDVILEKFKEKKLTVVVALREAIDAVFLTTSFEPILEDVLAALENKNPTIKAEAAQFLTRSFARATMASLPKKQLKAFCTSLCKRIIDTTPEVREASFNALGTAMKVVGEKPMQPYLADIDNLKLAKIKEYYDTAVLLNAQGEPRSGSSAPAPSSGVSAAKGSEPKPVKRPPPSAAAAKAQVAPAAAAPKAGKAKSAVAGKSKGPAKKGAAVKEEVIEMILSDEDVEAKAGSVLSAETLAQLDNTNWKERLAGMEKFKEVVEGLDKAEIPTQALIRMINKKPGLKDTNFQVLRLRIDLITLLAQKSTFTSRSSEFCICALVDKIGDVKNGSAVHEALTAIAESTSLENVSQEVVRLAFAQKNPKNQSESLNWLAQAVKEFGMKISVKPMITSIKTAFSATNPAIRTSAITLLGVLYMYMGPQLRMFFEGEKPALLQQIDAAFEKVKDEKPPPSTRGLRVQETGGEGEDKAESETEDDTHAVNLADLVPRTDISEKITEELITELGDKNWKVRNEGLQKVTSYINEAKLITCNIGQLPEAIKARLSDANKNLVMTSLTICQSMAMAMGPNCKTHVRTIGPALLVCIGDGKPQVRATAIATLNAWVEQCTLVPFVEGEILMDALKIENPNLRAELFGWLSERLPDHKQLPAAELRLCVPNLLSCLEDRNADVRKKSQEALVPFMIHLGYECFHKAAGKLKAASKDIVMAILEKVKGNIPVKAPVKKAAPVTKTASSSVSSKGPPSTDSDGDSPTGKDSQTKAAPTAAKKVPAKSKAPPPVSKKKKGDEDTGPAICVAVSREQRIKDEKTMKILKWNFTEPRLEFVEQIKGQMEKNFSKSLIDLLFKNDFKCHIKAIEVLIKALDTYPEETLSNLDLILKWTTLRFFDTNPSMLNKALEYLLLLFSHLAETDYHMSELDANSFIPYLLVKVGDSKENVRRHVRSILKLLCKLYPSSKMFGSVLDGLKSKNAKQRAECLDELGSLIEVYGINVCQPSPQQALKLITQQISDRDNTVRNAALNCIVSAYIIMGEGLYKLIGALNDKEQSLLDERIRRSNKNRPASAPPPQGNRLPLQKNTQHQANENTVSHRSPTKTSPTKGEYTLEIEGLDLKPFEQPKLYDCRQKFNELMNLPPVELPERRTPRVPRSAFIKMLGTATDTNTPITHVISQIPSADTNLCLGALAQIDEVLKDDQKAEMLISHVDHLLMMTVMQLRTLHNKHMSDIDMSKEMLFKLYRCLLATLLAVFQNPNLSRHASQGILKDVISCFVSLLLDTRLESYEQGEQIIQTVNIMVAKVLKTSNPAYVIGASIQLIQENVTQPGQGTKALELCMRCVWRLIKLLPDVINDLQVDRVLLDCHNFLTEFPSSTWKHNMDKPLRTIKTILYTLFKLQGDKLIRQTGLINDPNAEIMQYLKKLQAQAPGDRTKGYSDIEVDENQPPPKENKRSGSKLPEGAQDTLMEIFKNIGRRETMKEGLNDLYDFKQKYPELDLNLYLKHSSQYFRDYLDRHLTMIKQEREGTRPMTDGGKTGSTVDSTNSIAPDRVAYLKDSKVMDNYIDEVVQSSAQWRNRLEEFMQKYVPVDESGNSAPVTSTPAGRKPDPDIILSHSPIIPSNEVDVTDHQSSDRPTSDHGSNDDENEAPPSQTASLADLKKRLERIKNMAHS